MLRLCAVLNGEFLHVRHRTVCEDGLEHSVLKRGMLREHWSFALNECVSFCFGRMNSRKL